MILYELLIVCIVFKNDVLYVNFQFFWYIPVYFFLLFHAFIYIYLFFLILIAFSKVYFLSFFLNVNIFVKGIYNWSFQRTGIFKNQVFFKNFNGEIYLNPLLSP